MTSRSLPIVLALIGVCMLGGVYFFSRDTQPVTQPTRVVIPDGEMVTAELAGKPLQLEVVSSPARITRGLSGRSEIGSDGMLFLLGAPRIPSFWMKEMLIDLDMVWLLDNTVVDITHNVPRPSPNILESQLPTYSPKTMANQVLEIPAGTAQNWGLLVGDHLEIK